MFKFQQRAAVSSAAQSGAGAAHSRWFSGARAADSGGEARAGADRRASARGLQW